MGFMFKNMKGKKTILFATNYEVDKEELRNIYNIKNRGVDTFDQYLEISSIQRRTKKWYKKILLFGVDASIINAKILCELRTGRSYTTVKFKEKIIEHIFKIYSDYKKANEKNYHDYYDRYTKPKKVSDPRSSTVSNNGLHNVGHISEKKRCVKCHKRTPYICIECNVHLHAECFTAYHKKIGEEAFK